MAACSEDQPWKWERERECEWDQQWSQNSKTKSKTHKNYECLNRSMRQTRVGSTNAGRQKETDRERGREIRRERKNKPNNNIYDYFYEVLTNFYEFLMGPLHLCVFVVPLLLLLLQTEEERRDRDGNKERVRE